MAWCPWTIPTGIQGAIRVPVAMACINGLKLTIELHICVLLQSGDEGGTGVGDRVPFSLALPFDCPHTLRPRHCLARALPGRNLKSEPLVPFNEQHGRIQLIHPHTTIIWRFPKKQKVARRDVLGSLTG